MDTEIAEAPVTLAITDAEEIVPGSGFFTVTATLPTWALVAVPVAVSFVADTRVVLSIAEPNCTCAPVAKCAPFTVNVNAPTGIAAGAIVVTCGMGLSSVTALDAVLVASAVSTAVIVRSVEATGNSGALYKPALLMLPTDALPPTTPLTDHVTAGAVVAPPSMALKDCVSLPRRAAVVGDTDSCPFCGCGVFVPDPLLPPTHPATESATNETRPLNFTFEVRFPLASIAPLRFAKVSGRLCGHKKSVWRYKFNVYAR